MKRIYLITLIVAVLAIYTIIMIYGFLYLKNHHQVADNEALKISDYISAAVAIASTLIGCIAAILAYNNLLFARRAEEGKLYLSMMGRYSSQEMADAFRLLGQFEREAGENLSQVIVEWKTRRDSAQARKEADTNKEEAFNDAYALRVENARHKVKYFYRDLMQIHQAGYFSGKLTRKLLNMGGRHIFKKVVLPMDGVVNELQFKKEFYPFEDLFQHV